MESTYILADLAICRKCDNLAWNVGNNPWVQLLCNGLNNELQDRFLKRKAQGLTGLYVVRHDPQKIAYIEIDYDGNPKVSKLKIRLPENCPYHLEYLMKENKAVDETKD